MDFSVLKNKFQCTFSTKEVAGLDDKSLKECGFQSLVLEAEDRGIFDAQCFNSKESKVRKADQCINKYHWGGAVSFVLVGVFGFAFV